MTINTAIDIRERNLERIRSAIQRHETCTKTEIARETELSMATTSTALNEMLISGEIAKIDQTGVSIGRPADIFAYNPDHLHTLAICTTMKNGTDAVEYIIADALGRIIQRESQPIASVSAELLEALVTTCIVQDPLIRTVGLGIPGHAQSGCITQCDIAALEGVNFASRIRAKHDVAVVVENDMNIITYCLYQELDCPQDDFAALYFPTQENSFVGGGFIIGGRLHKGWTMFSGEVSYIARAFGFSSADQAALPREREAFCRFAAQIVTTVVCTINPPRIVIMGEALAETDLPDICGYCRQFIPAHNVPELRIDNNIFDNYAEGLVRLTLDHVLFPTLI